jgi:hypothetical protein
VFQRIRDLSLRRCDVPQPRLWRRPAEIARQCLDDRIFLLREKSLQTAQLFSPPM